jgi:hypothetical protein
MLKLAIKEIARENAFFGTGLSSTLLSSQETNAHRVSARIARAPSPGQLL